MIIVEFFNLHFTMLLLYNLLIFVYKTMHACITSSVSKYSCIIFSVYVYNFCAVTYINERIIISNAGVATFLASHDFE